MSRSMSTWDWIGWLVCVSVLAIPLTVSMSGRDSFRFPKELMFRAEMISLTALVLVGFLLKHLNLSGIRWRHPAIVIPLVAIGWTTLTTLTSSNRTISAASLAYVAGAGLVFIATFLVARTRELGMLRWVAWAGIVNAVLYLAVALRLIDNPLPLTETLAGHRAATGLLGNANDLGAALLPIAICATAAAIASQRHRILFTSTAVLVTTAVLVSVSVAAIGALVVALASMVLVWNWKRGIVLAIMIPVIAVMITLLHQPLKDRVVQMATAAESANWDEVSNGRLTAFAAAIEMFRDNPGTGTGPGTFGWQYYPYKLEVSERNPEARASVAALFNFEEVHNDHLEVLAETGAPGYLIFLVALIFVASGSLRRPRSAEDTDRARFARLAQLPLAAGTAVVALAQYPLQLTSSLTTLLFVIATCTAWRNDLEPITPEDVDA